jgi:O-antigen ligase
MAILVIMPLLFGAVHTYAYTVMTLGILMASALVLMAGITRNYRTGYYQISLLNTHMEWIFIAMAALMVWQMVPLPHKVVSLLSPEALFAGENSVPAAQMVELKEMASGAFSLSPYIWPVRMSLIRWITYALFFWGLTRVLNTRRRIQWALCILLAAGCFDALYGLLQSFSGSNHIWWYRRASTSHRFVFGTYINRNHFAGFMEMGILASIAFAGTFAGRLQKRLHTDGNANWRTRLRFFLSGDQDFFRWVLIVFSGVIMGIALIFSGSRGGMLSLAGGMLVMGILFQLRKHQRRMGRIILGLFVVTTLYYALQSGVERPLARFYTMDSAQEIRMRYTRHTMEMFRDYRLSGVGVGNFQYAYPVYQSDDDQKRYIRFAHNDWAQWMAETGLVGTALLLTSLVWILFRVSYLWYHRQDSFAVCLGMLPLVAVSTMMLHSFVDFNLHIPANALMLTALLAMGYSALHLKRRRGQDRMTLSYDTLPLKYRGGLILGILLILMVWSGAWSVRHFMAEAYCNTVPNSTLNRDPHPPLEKIRNAIAWDAGNAASWFKQARALIPLRNAALTMTEAVSPDENRHDVVSTQTEIIHSLEQAVSLNPLDARVHLMLGWEYTRLWRQPDYHQKWLPAADLSMQRCAFFAGRKNIHLHEEMGNYWTMRSKTLDVASGRWKTAWEKACRHYQTALLIESGKKRNEKMLQRIEAYVWNHYPDVMFVRQALGTDRIEDS